MTETAAAVETVGQAVNDKTICLAMRIGRFGNSKKAPLQSATFSAENPDQEPDKALLRLTKRLIAAPEIDAIAKHDAALVGKIRALSFSSLFKGGVYLLPIALVPAVEEILKEGVAVRQVLVDRAVSAYATRVAETVARLGVVSRTSDYPTAEEFRASYYLDYSYVTFETPTRLKAISAAIFEAETEKAKQRLDSVAEQCQQALRVGLAKLVEHLSDRLTPDVDGKPKKLHKTAISNLTEFLDVFALKNVTGDADLAVLVEKAKSVMAGVDQSLLKNDDLVRQKVLSEFEAIQSSLSTMVTKVEHGTRQIVFEDEDEGANG